MEDFRNKIIINSLNVNCWSRCNEILRSRKVMYNNPDIVCLTETHLRDNDDIVLEDYTYFGANRKVLNPKSTRGSGGIGLLIRTSLFNTCSIERCCEIDDYVLGILIKNYQSGHSMLVMCVYLPPEDSRYGQNNELILNLISYELFNNEDVDDIYICGDFNARIGKLNDSVMNSTVPMCTVLDDTINLQGQKLVNFCNDVNCCVVNGRVTTDQDDFTSLTSYKGKAVVDYHITRCENLKNITKT